MLSTLLELGGMASLTEAAYQLAGRGWAFAVAGVCLLAIGALTDDRAVRTFTKRILGVRHGRSGAGGKEAPVGASPHPSLDDLLDPGQEELYRHLAESAARRR